MTSTTINVFYYDADYFDLEEIKTFSEYIKQSLPEDTIILCLPANKIQLQQYPLEIKGDYF